MSVWNKYLFPVYDAVVVGAGYTGLNTALALKKKYPAWNICVLEKEAVGALASTNNAGFACFGSAGEILEDLKTMGRKEVIDLVARRFRGIQVLKQMEDIGLEFYGGYEVFTQSELETFEAIKSRLDEVNQLLLEATGQPEVFAVVGIEHFKMAFRSRAIYNALEFQLNPGLLYRKLENECLNNKIEVRRGTELCSFSKSEEGFQLNILKGAMQTKRLVLCTNALTGELGVVENISPARGQLLLTETLESNLINGNFHATMGYYYFRSFEGGIMLGGGRQRNILAETNSNATTTSEVQAHLEDYLTTHILPGKSPDITHRWAGIMAMGASKIPFVGKIDDNLYGAFAFGGMGVALSNVVGEELAEKIM